MAMSKLTLDGSSVLKERVGDGVFQEGWWSRWKVPAFVGASVALGVAAGFWCYRLYCKDGDELEAAPTAAGLGKDDGNVEADSEPHELSPTDKAVQLKNKGNRFFKDAKYSDAIDCYTQAISICPESDQKTLATFYQNRAAAFEHLQNHQKAYEDCTNALNNNSKYSKALVRRIKAAEQIGVLDKAFEDACYLCQLELYKNESTLSLSERLLSDLSRRNALKKMKTQKPFLPSKIHIRNFIEFFVNDPLMNFDNERAISNDSFFTKACKQFQNREFDNIIKLCSEELAESESEFRHESLLLRGTIYVLMGDFDNAVCDLDKLIDDVSVNEKLQVNALVKKGHLLGQRNESLTALTLFVKAIRIAPMNTDIYFHRGQHYLYLERIEDAYKDFQECAKLSPQFSLGHVYRCLAGNETSRNGNVASLVESTERSLQLVLSTVAPEHRLRLMQGPPEAFQKFRDDFQNVINKFPTCVEAHTKFGQILLGQSYPDEAEKHFNKILELQPDNAAGLTFLAALMLNFKPDTEEIMKHIEKAISVDDKFEYAYELLGTLQVSQGKISDAMENFRKAIELTKTENELYHLYTLLNSTVAQQNILQRK